MPGHFLKLLGVAGFLVLMSTLSLAQQAPIPVFAYKTQMKPFYDELEAIGTLRANEAVELMPAVTELITQINFSDGDRVKKGDVLVYMDIMEEQALRAEEATRVEEAERQLKRFESLIKKGAAPKSALDEQRLVLQTAQARIQAIDSQIRQRQIVAPFNGVVGLRNISVGALSQPGTVITTLDDDQIMKLDFSVSERYLSVLKPGLKIEATSTVWPDKVFTGVVASVSSRLDPVTRSIAVRALFDNQDYSLRPGLLMKVTMQSKPRTVLIIPETAILMKGDQHFVMVVKSEQDSNAKLKAPTVVQKLVEIGSRRKGEVEIVQGLNANELIVVHGLMRLQPGSEIKVEAIQTKDQTLTQLLEQSSSRALDQ